MTTEEVMEIVNEVAETEGDNTEVLVRLKEAILELGTTDTEEDEAATAEIERLKALNKKLFLMVGTSKNEEIEEIEDEEDEEEEVTGENITIDDLYESEDK